MRGGKSTLWEGGIRVNNLAWGGVLRKTGYENWGLMHATDWHPTLVKLAGGNPGKHISSRWAPSIGEISS